MDSIAELRERGGKRLKEVLGQDVAEVEATLGKLAPQAATFVIETIYGQIYQSPVLDTKTRQIVTIAALATLGTAPGQLKRHIAAGARAGLSEEEITEIMIQLIPYVGIATATNGLAACKEALAAATKK